MSVKAINKAPEYLKEARIKAGYANRDCASMAVPYSPETIGRHERGEVLPSPDDIIRYANSYNSPDILFNYCSECPVGKCTGRTATERPLPLATLRVSRMLEDAKEVADRLEEIAFDGIIDEMEKADFEKALLFLRQLQETISDIMLLGLKKGIKIAAPGATESGKLINSPSTIKIARSPEFVK